MITKIKLAANTLPREYQECECERCGFGFVPRLVFDSNSWVQELPVCCPKCRSVQWNQPRVNKIARKAEGK